MKAMLLLTTTLFAPSLLTAQQVVDPACPRIYLDAVGTPAVGKPLTVRVVSDPKLEGPVKYSWWSTGEIITGQRTPQVGVKMRGDSVTVKVDVTGPGTCHLSASMSTTIDRGPVPPTLIAKFTGSPRQLSVARYRSIVKRSNGDPGARLYVILNARKENLIDQEQKLIRRKLSQHGYPQEGSLVFVRGKKRDDSVEIWAVPAGALPPEK